MSNKQRTAEWHMERAVRMMNEIAGLPGNERERFLILKKKAEKHVRLAREIDTNAKITIKRFDERKR